MRTSEVEKLLRSEDSSPSQFWPPKSDAAAWGMSKAERVRLYRVAEDIPLSDRHAGHILSRLKRRAA